jgi:hypothetical protein
MSKRRRIEILQKYLEQTVERIAAIELDNDALSRRLDVTREQLLKMQAEAAGSKPLDLRESKFYPDVAKLPPDIGHFYNKAI